MLSISEQRANISSHSGCLARQKATNMSSLSKYQEPLNRPITGHERDLILWLLEHGEEGASRFIPQVDRLVAVAKCTCGCPTIDLGLENELVSHTRHGLISDYLAIVDGQYIGVMLFANEKQLVMLEGYSLAGTDKPFEFPNIESLFPWGELRSHPIPSVSDKPDA
jgi:hypothetical protein